MIMNWKFTGRINNQNAERDKRKEWKKPESLYWLWNCLSSESFPALTPQIASYLQLNTPCYKIYIVLQIKGWESKKIHSISFFWLKMKTNCLLLSSGTWLIIAWVDDKSYQVTPIISCPQVEMQCQETS